MGYINLIDFDFKIFSLAVALFLAGYFLRPAWKLSFRLFLNWLPATILATVLSIAVFLPAILAATYLKPRSNGLVEIISLFAGAAAYRGVVLFRNRRTD